MYDILILGSGPAGLTAALYAARANKKTLVLGGADMGGQLRVIHKLENYPGFIGTGAELAEFIKKQVESFGVEIVSANAKMIRNKEQETGYKVVADNGTEYESRVVIIATGATPRKLDITGAREFMGRGISYCATCDGFFYKDKDVLVIGGGNSALSDALYLADVAKSVTILYRKSAFSRAEQIQVDRVNATKNIRVMFNTELASVGGNDSGLTHAVTHSGETIACDGVFVAIGHEANTDFLADTFERDVAGRVVPDGLAPGMFVAGDVRSGVKMQVATAVGTGCECAIDAIEYLNNGVAQIRYV